MRILEWRLFRARRGLGTQSPGPRPGLWSGCAFGAWIRSRDQGVGHHEVGHGREPPDGGGLACPSPGSGYSRIQRHPNRFHLNVARPGSCFAPSARCTFAPSVPESLSPGWRPG